MRKLRVYSLIAQIESERMNIHAMNRPITETTPDSKVRTYGYNKAGLLETVSLDEIDYVIEKRICQIKVSRKH